MCPKRHYTRQSHRSKNVPYRMDNNEMILMVIMFDVVAMPSMTQFHHWHNGVVTVNAILPSVRITNVRRMNIKLPQYLDHKCRAVVAQNIIAANKNQHAIRPHWNDILMHLNNGMRIRVRIVNAPKLAKWIANHRIANHWIVRKNAKSTVNAVQFVIIVIVNFAIERLIVNFIVVMDMNSIRCVIVPFVHVWRQHQPWHQPQRKQLLLDQVKFYTIL